MSTPTPFPVFIFSNTIAYRHSSIPSGISGLKQLGASTGKFTTEASEDASLINAAYLSRFKAVVFLSTSGEFLTKQQLHGLKAYINNGGGFVGIHCAAAGMRSQPWYGELVGAYFTTHPSPQESVVRVESREHGIMGELPEQFTWFDEWYNFTWNPRDKEGVRVLLSIDEERYEGGDMGCDHPIAWCREFDGGRSFYTALGHFDEAFEDGIFLRHVLNGILWAARVSM